MNKPLIFGNNIYETMKKKLRAANLATDFTEIVYDLADVKDTIHFPVLDCNGNVNADKKGTVSPTIVGLTDYESDVKSVKHGIRINDDSIDLMNQNKQNPAIDQLAYYFAKKIDADLIDAIITDAGVTKDVDSLTADEINQAIEKVGCENAGILLNTELRKSLYVMDNFKIKTTILWHYKKDDDNEYDIPIVFMTDNHMLDSENKKALFAVVNKDSVGYALGKVPEITEERHDDNSATDITVEELYSIKTLDPNEIAILKVSI